MLAIVRLGGHQYQVSPGSLIVVQDLGYSVGSNINLSDILMVSNGREVVIEKQSLLKATVCATVLGHRKLKKVIVFKMRRRCGYKRKIGYRPRTTILKVIEITTGLVN